MWSRNAAIWKRQWPPERRRCAKPWGRTPSRTRKDTSGASWNTRPYMRARAALAECLWETGERDDAVAHWQDMLRLCPNDNLGVRHILGPKLLGLNQQGRKG